MRLGRLIDRAKAPRGCPAPAQQVLFHAAQRPKPAVPGAGG